MSAEFKLPLCRNDRSVSMARSVSTLFLSAVGVAAKAVADTALVVTELVANAVRHGEDPLGMGLAVKDDTVRIEVSDGGELLKPIVAASANPDLTDGRGLALVEASSERWGVEIHPNGKTVWAEVKTDVEP